MLDSENGRPSKYRGSPLGQGTVETSTAPGVPWGFLGDCYTTLGMPIVRGPPETPKREGLCPRSQGIRVRSQVA